MKIAVLVKQIPDTDSSILINDSKSDIVHDGLKFILNPFDEFAVEEAIQICEKSPGSKSTVITVGDSASEDILRTAIAMGVEEAIRIDNSSGENDYHKTAAILARYLKDENYDLILVGKEALDDHAASVGALVAEFLSLPFVSNVVSLNIGENNILTLHREKERGYDIMEVALPCVISCQKGLNKPRYPKLKGQMKAKKAKIPVKTVADLGFSDEELRHISKTKIIELTYPTPRAKGKKLEGEVEEMVADLVRELREVARVI